MVVRVVWFLLCLAFVSSSALASPKRIVIKLRDIKSDKGRFLVSVTDNPESFSCVMKKGLKKRRGKGAKLKGCGLVRYVSAAVDPYKDIVVYIPNKVSKFAVAIVQDEDGNGKMTGGLFGIPVEPYGFSGNPRARMGPPKFRDAVVTCRTSCSLDIALK